MILNLDRLHGVAEHVREAERLAQQELHSSHGHRAICRMAAMLSICRDVADDLLEQALQGEQRQEQRGRPVRDHF